MPRTKRKTKAKAPVGPVGRAVRNAVGKAVSKAVRGKGDYLSDLWHSNRHYLPRAVGGALGMFAGNPQAGWDHGANFSKNVLGWGRYKRGLKGSGPYGDAWSVASNSLSTDGNLPKLANIRDEGIRISHVEFLGVVTSSTTFINSAYLMNPGMSSTFPWLSKIAANFQQWKIHGCLVTFKSQMTEAVATFSALGSVAIAANMNPADRISVNQAEIEQLKFCTVSKPSQDMTAPIECAKYATANNSYFVRTGAIPSNASIMDYDHGSIQVAVNGCPAAGVVLGRLYITYDISLLNPKMTLGSSGCAMYRAPGATTTNYFGTYASMTKITDTLGITFSMSPNSTLYFPRGSYGVYHLNYRTWGDSTAINVAMAATYTNCAVSTVIKPFGLFASPLASCPDLTGITTGTQGIAVVFEISDPTLVASIQFTAGSMPISNTGMSLVIESVPATPGIAMLSLASRPEFFIPSYVEVPPLDDEKDEEEVIVANPLVPSAAQSLTRKALRP